MNISLLTDFNLFERRSIEKRDGNFKNTSGIMNSIWFPVNTSNTANSKDCNRVRVH